MIVPVSAPLPKANGIIYRSAAKGMGQNDDGGYFGSTGDGSYTDLPVASLPSTSTLTFPPIAPTDTGAVSPIQGTINLVPPSGSSSSGANNSNLSASTINTLVTAGTQIGKTLAAEAAPQGSQLLYNAQGQLVSATSIPSSLLTSATSSITSMLPWLLIAAAVAFVLESSRK
jgi:hypothetical protein